MKIQEQQRITEIYMYRKEKPFYNLYFSSFLGGGTQHFPVGLKREVNLPFQLP